MDKIQEKIENKVIGLIGAGRSLEELETRIEEFKDLDICWVSLDSFEVIDDYIFSKIDKKIEIIFSFGHFKPEEEIKKINNIIKFLKNGGLLVTNIFLRKYHNSIKFGDFYNEYKKNIFIIEEFKKNERMFYEFMSTPNKPTNSMILILPYLILQEPKKIILFGFDGGVYDEKNNNISYIKSIYYKSDIMEDRKIGDPFIPEEIARINEYLPSMHKIVKDLFQLGSEPEIINCSQNSQWEHYRKINYNQLKEEVK